MPIQKCQYVSSLVYQQGDNKSQNLGQQRE